MKVKIRKPANKHAVEFTEADYKDFKSKTVEERASLRRRSIISRRRFFVEYSCLIKGASVESKLADTGKRGPSERVEKWRYYQNPISFRVCAFTTAPLKVRRQ